MKSKIAKIESVIDEDYKSLKLWELNREFALLLVCTEYEKINYALNTSLLGTNSFSEKNKLKIKLKQSFDLLDWLVRHIYIYCPTDGGTANDDIKTFEDLLELDKIIEEVTTKGLLHNFMEQIFSPYWAGLYDGNLLEDIDDTPELEFTYYNQRVAEFEGINSILIEENHSSQAIKFEKMKTQLRELKVAKDIDHLFAIFTHSIVQNSFDLPNEFKIGPYHVEEIKRVWHKVLFEAWYREYDNHILLESSPTSDIELSDLKVEEWTEEQLIVDMSRVKKLLDDLTFTGKTKMNQNHVTPRSSPIFELSDGRKIVSPRFVINNSSQRSIIATLGHMYGEDTNNESELKETFFIIELSKITNKFPNLTYKSSIAITGTNVDFVVYDSASKTLCLFELKWFLEPISAREIKNKDTDIKKGLNQQLPKYKKHIEADISSFTRKAFGVEKQVDQIFYFVLTRNTIGSGLIKPNDFKVINIRMLEKSLLDSNGRLDQASTNLNEEMYYPKINEDFKIDKMTLKVGEVTVHSDVIIHLSDKFTLTTS